MRGFEVSTALNGDEAMAKLLQESPDIVILDVMMRKGSEGLEYLPKIKKALDGVKVIMVTGVDSKDTVEAAQKLGADDYITKPLVLEYLETTVLKKIKTLRPPFRGFNPFTAAWIIRKLCSTRPKG